MVGEGRTPPVKAGPRSCIDIWGSVGGPGGYMPGTADCILGDGDCIFRTGVWREDSP